MAFLEGKYTTYAYAELTELQELCRFLVVAGKSMEYTTRQVVTVFLQYLHHLRLCLAAMYHKGQTSIYGPFNLFLECLQLLVGKFATPIVVESDLTNGNETWFCGVGSG